MDSDLKTSIFKRYEAVRGIFNGHARKLAATKSYVSNVFLASINTRAPDGNHSLLRAVSFTSEAEIPAHWPRAKCYLARIGRPGNSVMARWTAIVLFAFCACLGCAGSAAADSTVQVLATYPSGAAVTLKRNQNFYLHLHYESDQPLHIWVEPYFQDTAVEVGSSPSRIHPAGSGEALGWFFLMQPDVQVDEVRIRAGDGSLNNTHVVATYPAHLSAGDQSTDSSATQPEWVARLNAQEQAQQNADNEKRANTPLSVGDVVLFSGLMIAVFGIGLLGFAAPARGLWKWRGVWRWAAAAPATLMAYVVVRLLIDTAIDRTSHNLWPFEILMFGVLSLAVMLVLVLAIAKKLVEART